MPGLVLLWLFVGVPLSLAAGLFAARLNRSSVGSTFFSLLLSPLVGFVFLLVLGAKESDKLDRVPCPFCSEPVQISAIRCPHCRSDL